MTDPVKTSLHPGIPLSDSHGTGKAGENRGCHINRRLFPFASKDSLSWMAWSLCLAYRGFFAVWHNSDISIFPK